MTQKDIVKFSVSSGIGPVIILPDKVMGAFNRRQPELLRGGLGVHNILQALLKLHLNLRPMAAEF